LSFDLPISCIGYPMLHLIPSLFPSVNAEMGDLIITSCVMINVVKIGAVELNTASMSLVVESRSCVVRSCTGMRDVRRTPQIAQKCSIGVRYQILTTMK